MVTAFGSLALIALLWLWQPWADRIPTLHAETVAFGNLQPGVRLTANLESYARSAAVREQYPELKELSRITRPANALHPARDLLTLEQRGFLHLEIRGRLTLDFFNDRLMEVTFFPDDLPAYAVALARAEPALRRERTGRRELLVGARRVISNVEQLTSEAGRHLGNTAFTLWQDRRLRAELDDWDRRFGHLAPPATPD